MKESKYQRTLVDKLYNLFPGCHIQRNDPRENQGIPDITIFWQDKWAMLEVKESASAGVRPNQEYHVNHFNSMSFAAFIFPKNEEQVLDELQRAFGSSR
jgi:hypothetical protein